MPERLQLLKQHQSRVEEHLKEVERHLEVIRFKVASYEQLHTQPPNGITVKISLKSLRTLALASCFRYDSGTICRSKSGSLIQRRAYYSFWPHPTAIGRIARSEHIFKQMRKNLERYLVAFRRIIETRREQKAKVIL